MLAGGGLVFLGMCIGRFMPARRRGPKTPKPSLPICGCDHHLSMHDPKTGECNEKVPGTRVPVRDEKGKPVKDNWGEVIFTTEGVSCPCKQYTGPQPLPE